MKGAQEMVNSGNNDNDRLQIVFSEVDSFLSDEPAERVKDFIRFTNPARMPHSLLWG